MKRPYKEAWPVEQAIAALHEGAGCHFDPALVEVFEICLPRIREIKTEWDGREMKALNVVIPIQSP